MERFPFYDSKLIDLFQKSPFDHFWDAHRLKVGELEKKGQLQHIVEYYYWVFFLLEKEHYARYPFADFLREFLNQLLRAGLYAQGKNFLVMQLEMILKDHRYELGLNLIGLVEKEWSGPLLSFYKLQCLILKNDLDFVEKDLVNWCQEKVFISEKLREDNLSFEKVYEKIIFCFKKYWDDIRPSPIIKEFHLRYYLMTLENNSIDYPITHIFNTLGESLLLFPFHLPLYLLGAKIYYFFQDIEMSDKFLEFIKLRIKNKDFKDLKRIERERDFFIRCREVKKIDQKKSLVNKNEFILKLTSLKNIDLAKDLFEKRSPLLESTPLCSFQTFLDLKWKEWTLCDHIKKRSLEQSQFYECEQNIMAFITYRKYEDILPYYEDLTVAFHSFMLYDMAHLLLNKMWGGVKDQSPQRQLGWYYLLAETYRLQGDIRGAIFVLKSVIQLFPLTKRERPAFLYFYASLLEKIGELARAVVWYKRVALLDEHYRGVSIRIKLLEKNR